MWATEQNSISRQKHSQVIPNQQTHITSTDAGDYERISPSYAFDSKQYSYHPHDNENFDRIPSEYTDTFDYTLGQFTSSPKDSFSVGKKRNRDTLELEQKEREEEELDRKLAALFFKHKSATTPTPMDIDSENEEPSSKKHHSAPLIKETPDQRSRTKAPLPKRTSRFSIIT